MLKRFMQNAGLVSADEPGHSPPPKMPAASLYQSQSAPPAYVAEEATDERALKIITDKVEQSPLVGYPDFVVMSTDLAGDIADLNIRARTALKSVMRMRSLSAQTVLDSVEDRILRLAAGREHLQASLTALLKDQTDEQTAIITAAQAERAALETTMAELRTKEATAITARATIESDLRRKQDQLNRAADVLAGHLMRDRQLITQNLN